MGTNAYPDQGTQKSQTSTPPASKRAPLQASDSPPILRPALLLPAENAGSLFIRWGRGWVFSFL